MKNDDYLAFIAGIADEIKKIPLQQRLSQIQKKDDDWPLVSDKLEKFTTVYNTLSPHPDLSEKQKTMMMCTFKHLDLITKKYAKRKANDKNIPSWQQENNTDAIWTDVDISEGFLTYNTKKGELKKAYYSEVTLYALQNLTPWVVKTNTYNTTLDQMDFSTGVTITKLVEDIVSVIAVGSPILQIMQKFSQSENNKNVKEILSFSLDFKSKRNTERLFQISPVGNCNGLLSFVATFFITQEKSKDFNSIFDFSFKKTSQMYAAAGILVHYDNLTWEKAAIGVIAATGSEAEKDIAKTLSLYED